VHVSWRCAQIHRQQKSGDTLVNEEYFQQRDSDEWLLKYHVTQPDSDTWALAEFDKVGGVALGLVPTFHVIFA